MAANEHARHLPNNPNPTDTATRRSTVASAAPLLPLHAYQPPRILLLVALEDFLGNLLYQ